ncbi:MAG TPA: hypothetical protein VH986_13280 [Acidimicrobiia bacterium]|jgi:hypothetical protein
MPPKDPLRPEFPPIPEKPPPFDLDALRRIGAPEPRRLRWRRRRGAPPELVDVRPKVTTARSSVVMLALEPTPAQSASIRTALAAGGAEYTLPPRLVLRNGLSLQDEAAWSDAVRAVTRAWRPFTVRLLPPEVIESRMLCSAPLGDRVADLQQAVGTALHDAGFVARVGDVSPPVVMLASTFTGSTHAELHALGNVVRDHVEFPLDFRVTALHAVQEASVDDAPPVTSFDLSS